MARKRSSGDVVLQMVVAYNSQDPEQPPEVMPEYGNNFAPVIGHIIGNWALLEQEMELLTTALLKCNNVHEPDWQRRRFSQRWELLQDQWRTFASNDPRLSSEMFKINKDMRAGKHVRDNIAHKRISFGLSDKGPWIRFQNENRAFPWTKRYFLKDFTEVQKHLAGAVGRFFRLTKIEYAQHFSSQSKSLLQQLPNMDYLRFPIR
jgi:hypothetical protein